MADDEALKPRSIPYQLRIGVTGHRDLQGNDKQVGDRVVAVLDEIEEVLSLASSEPRGKHGSPQMWIDRLLVRLGQTRFIVPQASPEQVDDHQQTPLRWTVISALAKGADQIVANEVLAREPSALEPENPLDPTRLKPQLEVVTPFLIDEYRKDFSDPADDGDLAELDRLFNLDPHPTELDNERPEYRDDDSEEQSREKHRQRDIGYLRAGQHVVDACEVLIVVWDGNAAKGLGGTGNLVPYAVSRGRTVLWVKATHLEEGIRWIRPKPKSRKPDEKLSYKNEQGESSQVEVVYDPFPTMARQISQGFHRLSAFNRDGAFDKEKYEDELKRTRNTHLAAAVEAGLDEEKVRPLLDAFLPHFERASQLAAKFQTPYRLAAKWLHRLAALAVSVVVFQVLFFPNHSVIVAIEVIAMLLLLLLHRMSRVEAWHEKWLHDRYVAEQWRIEMYAKLLGLGDTDTGHRARGQRSTQGSLPFYRSPDSWILDAVLSVGRSADPPKIEPHEVPAVRDYLNNVWITSQVDYHANKAPGVSKAAHRSHRWVVILFTTTLATALLHLFGDYLGIGHEHGASADGIHVMPYIGLAVTFLAIALPAWAATIDSVNLVLERDRMAVRSQQMAEVLTQIQRRVGQADDLDELRAEIARAKQVMATENHEWWVALSFRELGLVV